MIYTFPIISALIGWITNFLAIKMLFHPRTPIRVLGVTLQGVFPKRQQLFAEKIASLVSEQLFSFNDIKSKLTNEESTAEILLVVDAKIDVFLKEKLVAAMHMLGMIMGDDLRGKIKSTLMEEFNSMLPDVINRYADKLEASIDIKSVVKEKVEGFSFDKMEEVMFSIMSKEFKFIELIGAVLGFIIGLVQVLLFKFI